MASSVHTTRSGFLQLHSLRAFARSVSSRRPFSATVSPQTERRPNGKDDIYVDSNEYSKSGYDGQAAQTKETAFSKARTAPDEQLIQAEHESKKIGQNSNPLDVSPANREVSKTSQRRPGEEAKQTKAAGQESRKETPPKHEGLRQYDPSAGTVPEGTGSEPTRRDEKPGPAFFGTRGR